MEHHAGLIDAEPFEGDKMEPATDETPIAGFLL
jgi:hypothetical protein